MSNLPDQDCKNCPHGNKCSEIYDMLGKSNCKPVTTSVSIAFLLPLVVLIITMVVFEEYCSGYFENKITASLVSLTAGVLAGGISVYIACLVNRKIRSKSIVEKDIK